MAQYRVLSSLSEDMRRGGDVAALLGNHLQTPEKVPIYYNALSKCVVNGQFVYAATWSWWAFFGGAFYFFYRKMYAVGVAFLLVSFLLPLLPIPFAGLLSWVAAAMLAKYFYCRKFIADLDIAGYPERPFDDVEYHLRRLGGYNTWAIAVGILVWFLSFVWQILYASAILGFGMLALLFGSL